MGEGMKLVAISDTHNRHNKLVMPEGDVLIHAGDATGQGRLSEVTNFLEWMGKQNYKHKILIAGNHDWLFEVNPVVAEDLCKDNGIIYLNDSGVEIDGVKFWGSPITPHFFS